MDDPIIQVNDMENGFDNIGSLYNSLSDNDNYSDNEEQEEQEEQVDLSENGGDEEVSSSETEILLSDLYDEVVSLHGDVLVLNDNINNVALCISDFAGVVVEFFIIFIIMVLIGTVFNNLLHFLK